LSNGHQELVSQETATDENSLDLGPSTKYTRLSTYTIPPGNAATSVLDERYVYIQNPDGSGRLIMSLPDKPQHLYEQVYPAPGSSAPKPPLTKLNRNDEQHPSTKFFA
jgi:hypothetical protein